MSDIRISRKAAGLYYGGDPVVIVCSSLAVSASKCVANAGFQLLVLSPIGVVQLANETVADPELSQRPLGVGCGLRAFLTTNATTRAAAEWQEFTRKCAPHISVIFSAIDGLPWQRGAKVEKAMYQLLSAEVAVMTEAAAVSMAETRALRRTNEQLHLENTKLSRTLEAFGASRQYLLLELKPSDLSIGPEDEQTEYIVEQSVPFDVSAVTSLGLFVSLPTHDDAMDGALTVSLKNSITGSIIGTAERQYHQLCNGWNRLQVSADQNHRFGDACLVVAWQGDGAHPKVALSGVKSDEDDAAGMLAIQVYSGYQSARMDNAAAGYDLKQPMNIAALRDRLSAISGQQGTLSFDEAQKWFQTHAVMGGVSGAKLKSLNAQKLDGISVSAFVDHEDGPTARFWLVLVSDVVADQEITSAIDTGSVESIAIASSVCEVAPTERTELHISLPDDAEQSATLYFCVETLSESADFGWCRWSELTLHHRDKAPDQILTVPNVPVATPMRELRCHRFPELFSQIDYIEGKVGAQKVFDEAGYSPLIVSEENGSLQTHPIKNGVSAAVCKHMIASDTVSISCEIKSAHPDAPEFIYILVGVGAKHSDLPQLLSQIAATVRSGNHAAQLTHNGAPFSSKIVSGGGSSTITLDSFTADENLDLRDIVCAVIPVEDNTSFGWCRWNNISIERVLGSDGDG